MLMKNTSINSGLRGCRRRPSMATIYRIWMGRCAATVLLVMVCHLACVNRGALGGATSTMYAAPATAPADGNTPITVYISVAPQDGTLPGDARVVITSSDANAIITQPAPLGAENNAFVATVRSSHAGTQTLTAELASGGLRLSLTASAVITFNPADTLLLGVPDPNETTLTANPNQVSSDGSTSTLLTLVIHDTYGTPVVGVVVTFTSTGSNNFFSQCLGSINGDF